MSTGAKSASRWVRLSAPRGAAPIGALLAALAGVAGAGALWLGLDRLPLTLCYFKALSGWPCLSCGATRAVVRLAAQDLHAALAMNPLATAAALALVPWGAADLALMTRGRALRASLDPRLRRPLLWVLGALAVVNWAYLVVAGR